MNHAVALITCATDKGPDSVCLIIRAESDLDPWSGHVALPGGRQKKSEADLITTAIRETREETGIPLTPRQLAKPLPPAKAGRERDARLLVQPFWFRLPNFPGTNPDPREVAALLWVPFSEIRFKIAREEYRAMDPATPTRNWPGIPVESWFLWGFTYRVIKNFIKMEYCIT